MPKRLTPKDYFYTAQKVAYTVTKKNVQYGDSFSDAPKILAILYPKGIAPEKYGSVLTIVRVLDKLKRIATDNDPTGESPWADIAGYALLELAKEKV